VHTWSSIVVLNDSNTVFRAACLLGDGSVARLDVGSAVCAAAISLMVRRYS
jgi:hypothetical protein